MKYNLFIWVIGALIAIILGFVYYTYQKEKKPSNIEIKIGQIIY
ncbi:hypothetical protein [Bartonella callosciuri]|nr:hypothetical protein [Bartonella callosciuri]